MTSFDHHRRPLVIGIGGTTRAASSTERALGFALRGAQAAGAHTRLFGGTFLHSLPHYAPKEVPRPEGSPLGGLGGAPKEVPRPEGSPLGGLGGAPENPHLTDEQLELIEAVRHADALIIATPGYHGGVSGLVKNALDTLEELRADERPYLDGRAVGCIVTAYGWQAAGSVLTSLRSIVHALRGWPTPFGAGINTLETRFDTVDTCSDPKVIDQLATVGQQVTQFALAFNAHRTLPAALAAAPLASTLKEAPPARLLHAV